MRKPKATDLLSVKNIIFVIPLMLVLSSCEEASLLFTTMDNDTKRMCEAVIPPPPEEKMQSCRVMAALVIEKGVDECYEITSEVSENPDSFSTSFKTSYLCRFLATKVDQFNIKRAKEK